MPRGDRVLRYLVGWVLILHAVHLPIPFPDLDGECRGTPIHSLAEEQAWHIVLLGVQPQDDIDRGPIRTGKAGEERLADTLFGAYAVIAAREVLHADFAIAIVTFVLSLQITAATWLYRKFRGSDVGPPESLARNACISFCSWQI